MPRAKQILTVAVCSLAMVCLARRAPADEPLKQRLLAEAPARWAELERASKHVTGAYTKSIIRSSQSPPPILTPAQWAELDRTSDQGPGGFTKSLFQSALSQPPRFIRHVFAISGADMKIAAEFAEKPDEKPKAMRVQSVNKKYIFQIDRSPIAPKYTVSYVLPNGDQGDPAVLDKVVDIIEGYKSDIFCPWYLLGRPLSAWLNDPGLKIVSVDPVEVDGRKVARVKFDYASADDPADKLSDSHVDLDIEGHWTIRGYLARRPWVTVEAKLTYGGPIDGIPVVRLKEQVLKGDGATVTGTLEMESFRQKEVPPSEFTLPAYGLPEPNFH